jgi:hypothetical protein
MAVVLVKFDGPVAGPGGKTYFAQAAGNELEGGLWEGWLEFQPIDGEADALVSGRETTQPNRTNIEYWAQGLTTIYLEGALARAISVSAPPPEKRPLKDEAALFSAPGTRTVAQPPGRGPVVPRPILDPFEVYAQGEEILRRELHALARDHIESIASGYRIGNSPNGIDVVSKADLIDAIVRDVRMSGRPRRDSGESQPRP